MLESFSTIRGYLLVIYIATVHGTFVLKEPLIKLVVQIYLGMFTRDWNVVDIESKIRIPPNNSLFVDERDSLAIPGVNHHEIGFFE